MTGENIIGALIGLVGAVSNNGKTENTDCVVREALTKLEAPEEEERLLKLIRNERFMISPGCMSCSSPCGNTSDYPLDKLRNFSGKTLENKERLLHQLSEAAAKSPKVLPESFYRGILFLGQDTEEEFGETLLPE